MPFSCHNVPAVKLCYDINNVNKDKGKISCCDSGKRICSPEMIVGQENSWFHFPVHIFYCKWKVVRLIWIGFYKNDDNKMCLIGKIPKDVIQHLLCFLGTIFSTELTTGICI